MAWPLKIINGQLPTVIKSEWWHQQTQNVLSYSSGLEAYKSCFRSLCCINVDIQIWTIGPFHMEAVLSQTHSALNFLAYCGYSCSYRRHDVESRHLYILQIYCCKDFKNSGLLDLIELYIRNLTNGYSVCIAFISSIHFK